MQNNEYLYYQIAKLYYMDKLKQNEIAKRLDLTTMTVSRYLKEAEKQGIVTFHVKSPWKIDLEKSEQMREKFNLKECVVIKVDQGEDISLMMAKYLADYITTKIRNNMVVGISWGSTISKFVELCPYLAVSGCTVIQLSGAFVVNNYSRTPQNITMQLAQKLSSLMYTFNAPLYVANENIQKELVLDPTNQELLKLADQSRVNIFGVSVLEEVSTTYKMGTINSEELKELTNQNAIGDIAGIYVDQNGDLVEWSKKNCYTGVSLNTISKAETSICIAGEKEKAKILEAGAKKGYYNTLITSEDVANILLNE